MFMQRNDRRLRQNAMDFISFKFYIFLIIVLAIYYILPLRFRWIALLSGSLAFFWLADGSSRGLIVFVGIIAISWALGLALEAVAAKEEGARGASLALLLISVAGMLVPLIVSKYSALLYFFESLIHKAHTGVLVSVGLSFFTMQIIAYLVDVYRGRVKAQRNPFKYALFVSFFPQLIQGPIPRYEQLGHQLYEGHRFDENDFVRGFMLILWGFFLKLMIADRAGIIVDTIFDSYTIYRGCYVLVGGVLYSIQLYADFLACVTLAQGIAALFGIHLIDNFNHPYFSTSIREFWSRWHMSLSSWLRDYVYIPLGGNRKGRIRKYVNIVITFAVSGLWHGSGIKYLFWGMMHAFYEIAGSLTEGIRDRLYSLLGFAKGRRARTWAKRVFTFFFVMIAWIVFRADTLEQGLSMIASIFTTYNPWIFSGEALLNLGLEWAEWMLLIASVAVLIFVSTKQEAGVNLCGTVLRQPLIVRWALYILVISVIIIFGSYGYGYNAADFIYGGF